MKYTRYCYLLGNLILRDNLKTSSPMEVSLNRQKGFTAAAIRPVSKLWPPYTTICFIVKRPTQDRISVLSFSSCVVMRKGTYLSKIQFSHLQKGRKPIHSAAWGLSILVCAKSLAWCQAQRTGFLKSRSTHYFFQGLLLKHFMTSLHLRPTHLTHTQWWNYKYFAMNSFTSPLSFFLSSVLCAHNSHQIKAETISWVLLFSPGQQL